MEQLRTARPQQLDPETSQLNQESHAWLVSVVVHLSLLLVLALVTIYPDPLPATLSLLAPAVDDVQEPELGEEFHFAPEPAEETGAISDGGLQIALAGAPELAEISVIPKSEQTAEYGGTMAHDDPVDLATSPILNKDQLVRGQAGVGVTGIDGAIDRITHEILLSLEERKTLVVWLFDQSASLLRQRQEIHDRFNRIYQELGLIESAGHAAFRDHLSQAPLLTSVVAFGKDVDFRTRKPTDDLAVIKQAVAEVPLDDSGIENVFSAVHAAANRFKALRKRDRDTQEPSRNVLMVIVTDEAGDDPQRIDRAVELCRNFAMPVFVIGVPAPFGRQETLVKWVDPDPKFDQSPQWGRVNQGPESLLPERLKIHFGGDDELRRAIDSGFGPYGLTRLAYESGGVYFALHPNRDSRRPKRRETAAFSAYFEHFFDRDVMRRYRPDYVSAAEYRKRLKEHPSRAALVRAAEMSWLTPMEGPRLRFVKTDEATLASQLSEAQKLAAKLEPKINSIYETMKQGEADRATEQSLRWQAGFDLAMGRILALKVRTESYNAMLAAAKRGMKFQHERNNTWALRSDNEVTAGSQLAKLGKKAREYLERVVREHPKTPWELVAARELRQPMSWKWTETFTNLDPPPSGNGNVRNRPPRDDRRRSIPRKPKRPVPRL